MACRISQRTISKIQKLRRLGYSIGEIKAKVPIGYGSIWKYIKDIQIGSQHKAYWMGKRGGSRKRKALREKHYKNKAKKEIANLTRKDMGLIVGMLYWAEGNKNDFIFTNSDPEMIKIFVYGLTYVFGVSEERIQVSLRIYEDLDRRKCLDFWSKVTGLSSSKFVNVYILKGKKHGKLPHGLCRLRLSKGGNMLKYVVAIRKRVFDLYLSNPRSSTDRTEVS